MSLSFNVEIGIAKEGKPSAPSGRASFDWQTKGGLKDEL
jgi:hypothetical protein